MGSKAPKPTNPKETSAAATGTNVATAIANGILNNPNEVGPDGTKTTDFTGSKSVRDPYTGKTYNIPLRTITTTLSEAQQKIKNQHDASSLNLATIGNEQSGRIGDLLGDNLNFEGAPEGGSVDDVFQSGVNDYSQDRQRVEDALFDRLNSSIGRDRERLQDRLSNQGIKLGSDAYSRAMTDMGQNANDARTAAILGAGQEQSRLQGMEAQRVGMDLNRFNAANVERNQALNETTALRNAPLNEIGALMSGGQVSNPNFMTGFVGSNIANTNNAAIIGNYDSAMAQRARDKNAAIGSMIGAGGKLFGMGF